MGRAARGLDWSPDGTRLVWVYPGDDGVEALWIRSFPDGEASALLRPSDLGAEGDELPRGLGWVWLPDGRGMVLSHGGDLLERWAGAVVGLPIIRSWFSGPGDRGGRRSLVVVTAGADRKRPRHEHRCPRTR